MIFIRALVEEYNVLLNKYSELFLDFVLLEIDGNYLGENTHRETIKTAFTIFNERERVAYRLNLQYTFD